jgi:hypothetical protein
VRCRSRGGERAEDEIGWAWFRTGSTRCTGGRHERCEAAAISPSRPFAGLSLGNWTAHHPGSWLQAGVYLQGVGGLEPEQLYPIPYASHYAPQGLAVGDFSSDLCTDLAIADSNQGLVILRGSGCLAVFSDGFESGDTGAWSLTVP